MIYRTNDETQVAEQDERRLTSTRNHDPAVPSKSFACLHSEKYRSVSQSCLGAGPDLTTAGVSFASPFSMTSSSDNLSDDPSLICPSTSPFLSSEGSARMAWTFFMRSDSPKRSLWISVPRAGTRIRPASRRHTALSFEISPFPLIELLKISRMMMARTRYYLATRHAQADRTYQHRTSCQFLGTRK